MSIPKTTKFTLRRIVENIGKIPNNGFAEETPKLTPEQKKRLMEMASMFENYGMAIRNEEAIMNSAKSMTELCELAESYALNECGDWFQQEIVKKDMKELKKKVMEYNKIAKEGYARMQQLGVAYQDIGHILGRYYDLRKAPKDQQYTKSPITSETMANEEMKTTCAWCGKDMGTKAGKGLPGKSNDSICDDCKRKYFGDTEGDKTQKPTPSTPHSPENHSSTV